MEKRLALETLSEAMERVGLSGATLARELGVSRETASKWLNGKSFPRPDKLLKLALLSKLRLNELVVRGSPESEPVIAFRKRAGSKTTEKHISRAKEMGLLLKPLVFYLPFDEFIRPPTLKKPSPDYDYVQRLVAQVRENVGITVTEPLDYRHLIKRFTDTQTVLIPVLWGKKGHHENALHIFLPDSETTWVYLNLDVEVHDFKFWMAHELGHVLAPQLVGNDGEDFADAFAGALLFPEPLARQAYDLIAKAKNDGHRINRIKKIAEEHLISPITVYYETNHYAKSQGLSPVDLGNGIFGAAKNLSKEYYSVSEAIFGQEGAIAKDYVAFAKELQSPFFDALGVYLRDTKKGPGYVQSVLDVPLMDAREIHAELV
jgi:transcriptional regulator with XRE-family HTH domain